MDIILLAKILAALEWQNQDSHIQMFYTYITERHFEILHEVQEEFNHLYLEV